MVFSPDPVSRTLRATGGIPMSLQPEKLCRQAGDFAHGKWQINVSVR
jgi:hypothetical protein